MNAKQARWKTQGFTETFKKQVIESISSQAEQGYCAMKVTVPRVSLYQGDVKVESQGKYLAQWLAYLGYRVTPLTFGHHIVGSGRFDQADIIEVEW